MSILNKLKSLDIRLPEAPDPLGSYVPCVRTGNLVFVSGMLPLKDGRLIHTGKVGSDVSIEDAQESCELATINALSVIRSCIGSLDDIERCIKINGFISSAEGFFEQPSVLNAASDLLFKIFGDKGKHSRAAVGVFCLPLNSPVEIDFVFEVK
ncbi:MAG: RidA family protein [Nitrospirota bacterium]|nr:MAG: RidA family protein [Nitrospirota bacterium]